MLFMAAESVQTAASCILRTWSHAVACAPSRPPGGKHRILLLVDQGQSGLILHRHTNVVSSALLILS
jgi:hypothetical protein